MKPKWIIVFCIILVTFVFVNNNVFACPHDDDDPNQVNSPPVPDEDPNVSQSRNPGDPNADPNLPSPDKDPKDKDTGGDPVNLISGKIAYSATDLVVKGRKLAVVIGRFYQNGFTTFGTVSFDGSASYDSDGTIAEYDWRFPQEAYDIANASEAISSCKFTVPGIYNCSYRVKDNQDTWSDYVYFDAAVDVDVKTSRFGYNWDMNYNLKVAEVNENAIIFYNGRTYRIGYNKVGGSSPAKYVSPTDISNYFLKEDGLFTLYKKYGIKYKFDSDGCLWRIEDSFGNAVGFSYTGSGLYKKLTTITDDLNRDITLTYNDDGLLWKVTDAGGRVWEYIYNGNTNNLVSVKNPADFATTYSYDSRHNLVSATDPNGQTWLMNTFDSSDRVVYQKYGDGYYDYIFEPEHNLTIVTDRTDVNSLNFYDDNGSVISNIVYSESDRGCAAYSTREPNLISYWTFDENLPASDCGCQDPCIITSLAQLQNIKDDLAGCYVLGCDIDASDTVTWNGGAGFEPIGNSASPFTGCFDGRGYTIDGLFIDRPTTDCVGFFGKTAGGAVIKNLGLTNVDIAGQNYVGGLAGYCDSGSIVKCYTSGAVSGSVDVSPPSYTPTAEGVWAVTPYSYYSSPYYYHYMEAVTATDDSPPVEYYFKFITGGPGIGDRGWSTDPTYTVGPLIGECLSAYQTSIRDQAGNGIVSSIWHTYYGNIQDGYTYTAPKIGAGGLVGYSNGNLSQCYSVVDIYGYDCIGGMVGRLESGLAENCYSAGAVSGTSNIGGFCGAKNTGTVTDCFYDSDTSGWSDTGKGTPRTTSQMIQQATFANWDFNDIWEIDEGVSYPYLIYGDSVADSAGWNNGKAYLPQSTAGKVGGAFRFDGDSVRIRDSNSLDLEKFTISVWIYKEANTDYAGIVTKCDVSWAEGFNFDLREAAGGKVEIRFYTGSTLESVISNNAVSTSQWHYIVATFDGDKLRLYIDGQEAGAADSVAGHPNTGDRDLYIGAAFCDGSIDESRSFKGIIDEVKIYGKALLEYEIHQLYEFNGRYITDYEHDSNRNVTRIIYPAGNCSDFTYDAVGNVTSVCQKPAVGVSGPNIVASYTYDANFSFVKTVTGPRGNVTTFNYNDSNGSLQSIVLPQVQTPDGNCSPVVSFTYNEHGQVETSTSPDGIITRYVYYSDNDNNDPNCGRLWKVIADANETDGLKITTKFSYDMQGNVIEIKDANNQLAKFAYNQLGLLTQTISPLNYVTDLSYNENKQLQRLERKITDVNQATTYSYDILDNLKTITDPLGFITSYSYDLSENLSDVNDAEENNTHSDYDERGLLWKVTDANGSVTEYCYAPNGQLAKIKDANGNETIYDYDNFDRLTTVTYAAGSQESFIYDAASNVISFTNRGGQTIDYTYDALNRVLTKTMPQEGQGGYTSGCDEYTTLMLHLNTFPFVDEAEHSVTNNGVDLDTTQKMFGAASAALLNAGDYLGLAASDDWNFDGDFTIELRFRRTSGNNCCLIKSTSTGDWDTASAGDWCLEYDGNGRLAFVIKGRPWYGANTDFSDSNWHHIAVTRSGSTLRLFLDGVIDGTFTNSGTIGNSQALYIGKAEIHLCFGMANGNVDEIRISKGIARWTSNFTPPSEEYTSQPASSVRTIAYTYDIAGRIYDVNDNGKMTSYSYDRIGRLEEVVDTENRNIGYEYDNLGRRTKLIYPDDSEVTYEYDAESRLTKVKYQGQQIAQYQYDELSRRTLLTYGNGTSIAYLYDLGDRLTRITNNMSSAIDIEYSQYDNVGNRLNMLVNGSEYLYSYDNLYQLTYADYPAGLGSDADYYYDAVGNRTSVIAGSTTSYLHNRLNQYDSIDSVVYSYDARGNLTNDGTYKYYYDCENRLTDVNTIANTKVAHYNYDFTGRRVSRTTHSGGTVTVKYAYDGDDLIAEYSLSGALLKKYIYGPGTDEPIMMLVVNGGETRYYYHYDGLGSVVALSNNNGALVEKYSYDVFGAVTIRDASDQILTTSNFGNCRMFTGREYDTETSLYYYRARYYKPSIGRFLQTDPIGYSGGINLYAYCSNNPLRWRDPWGLCKKDGGQFQGFGEDLLQAFWDAVNIASNAMSAHMFEGRGIPGWADSGPALARQGTAGQVTRVLGYISGASAAAAVALEALGLDIVLWGTGAGEAANNLSGRGGIGPVQIGQAGERAVGLSGPKKAIMHGGRKLFPDQVTKTTLTEVKNVATQSFTKQLRNYSNFAKENGLKFELYIRSTTQMSKPLKQAIDSKLIIQKPIPGG